MNSGTITNMLEKASEGITAAEAARRLGVDAQTVRNWIRTGKLPATSFGPEGARIIRVDPVDIANLRRPTGPEAS